MRSWPAIRALVLGALVTAAACVSRGPDVEPERSPRFVGSWIVEQPDHALYEATVYDLRANGSVGVGPTYVVGDVADGYVTGSVADPAAGVSCVLANRWYSTDDATLVVDGNCSDGRYREIVLGFENDSDRTADVVVLSVGGEDGWIHDDWSWRWRRCADAGCELP